MISAHVQKLYVTMFPCNECAKLLIQAGLKEVIFHEVSHPAMLPLSEYPIQRRLLLMQLPEAMNALHMIMLAAFRRLT